MSASKYGKPAEVEFCRQLLRNACKAGAIAVEVWCGGDEPDHASQSEADLLDACFCADTHGIVFRDKLGDRLGMVLWIPNNGGDAEEAIADHADNAWTCALVEATS